jgi:transcriptional regulator with PAS, ATPase and Fis domain
MLVGQSAGIQAVRARVARVAPTTFTVLIEGESGAGKELVARELHARSGRERGPFVPVNCAALVETLVEAELFGIEERTATGVRGRRGKFELADGGTLFLDEVGDLSAMAQAKLLRVLQDMTIERVGGASSHRLDTRVIAATNRNLHDMVAESRFRADLYYRLAGVEIAIPPLRARREDIPLLINHFLAQHSWRGTDSLSSSAYDALMAYEWPGNVRQLERVLERAVVLAAEPQITIDDLPAEILKSSPAVVTGGSARDDSRRAWSSRHVREVLERNHGNKRRTCQLLDITYHTLQALLAYDSSGRAGVRGAGKVGFGLTKVGSPTAGQP